MTLSKVLGSLLAVSAVSAAVVTLSMTASAGGDEELISISCSGGDVTATAKSPWHTNDKAPWKWDKGEKVSVDEKAAKFKGAKCEGTVKAYICNGDSCKGPIQVPVK